MLDKNTWLYGLSTDTGTVRKENQDHIALLFPSKDKGNGGALAMVADGMGGHAGGSMASGLAIQLMSNWWENGPGKGKGHRINPEQVQSEVAAVFQDINNRLVEYGNRHDQSGTTLSALILNDQCYHVFHVGDSRIYRLRTHSAKPVNHGSRSAGEADTGPLNATRTLSLGNPLWQLTEDQSWVGQQVKHGLMTWEEARVHPRRNLLLNCLGVDESLNIFYQGGSYSPGDLFMLCSDGYHGMFSEEEISQQLQRVPRTPEGFQIASQTMMVEALHRGSQDNVSVMLLQREPYVRSGWSRVLSLFEKRR